MATRGNTMVTNNLIFNQTNLEELNEENPQVSREHMNVEDDGANHNLMGSTPQSQEVPGTSTEPAHLTRLEL